MFKKTEGFDPVGLPPPLPELERAGRGSAAFSPAKLALSHLSLARGSCVEVAFQVGYSSILPQSVIDVALSP
jgi:hypothetical protein